MAPGFRDTSESENKNNKIVGVGEIDSRFKTF